MSYYIYMIKNLINNKVYIGQTENLKRRFAEHKSLGKYKNRNHPLYNSIKNYGIDNFSFNVIEIWITIEETDKAEQFQIECLDSQNSNFGYNLTGGGRITKGFIPNKLHKQTISESLKAYYKTHKCIKPIDNNIAKGENSCNAKTTNVIALEIRKDYLSLQYSIQEIANKYKISRRIISNIIYNKTYKDNEYGFNPVFHEQVMKLSSKRKGYKETRIIDHNGKLFYSIKEVASYYSITKSSVISILKNKIKSSKINNKYWFYYAL